MSRLPGVSDPSWQLFVILALAGLLAGWVDAVVGGGGLIQLPAILLALPTANPAQVLATNKLASFAGTSVSAITYWQRLKPDLKVVLPMAAAAYLGSVGGALVGLHIPKAAFYPIIFVMLIAVGGYTLFKPALGQSTSLRFQGVTQTLAAMGIGLVIGAYDGALGPGTGSFFIFALVGLLGYAFLDASAMAKAANLATNLGALTVFAPGGHVIWALGLVMAGGNIIGGYLGARTAMARGGRFVRAVFVVVVSVFIVRIGAQLLGWW